MNVIEVLGGTITIHECFEGEGAAYLTLSNTVGTQPPINHISQAIKEKKIDIERRENNGRVTYIGQEDLFIPYGTRFRQQGKPEIFSFVVPLLLAGGDTVELPVTTIHGNDAAFLEEQMQDETSFAAWNEWMLMKQYEESMRYTRADTTEGNGYAAFWRGENYDHYVLASFESHRLFSKNYQHITDRKENLISLEEMTRDMKREFKSKNKNYHAIDGFVEKAMKAKLELLKTLPEQQQRRHTVFDECHYFILMPPYRGCAMSRGRELIS